MKKLFKFVVIAQLLLLLSTAHSFAQSLHIETKSGSVVDLNVYIDDVRSVEELSLIFLWQTTQDELLKSTIDLNPYLHAINDGQIDISQVDILNLFGSFNEIKPSGKTEIQTARSTITGVLFEKDRLISQSSFPYSDPIDIETLGLEEGGIRGILISPMEETSEPPLRPLIVMLGGSEGGVGTLFYGSKLAQKGYSVLIAGYFDPPSESENSQSNSLKIPQCLNDIEITKLEKLVAVAKSKKGIDPSRTALIARSRGTEYAVLATIHNKYLFDRVFLISPMQYFWPGQECVPPQSSRTPWLINGHPVEPIPIYQVSRWQRIKITIHTKINEGFSAKYMKNFLLASLPETVKQRSLLRYDQIEVPAHVYYGKDDQLISYQSNWLDAFRNENFIIRQYDRAGHDIMIVPYTRQQEPGSKVVKSDLIYGDNEVLELRGGDIESNRLASIDVWLDITTQLSQMWPNSQKDE